ncbi:hypothetical protein GCM10027432_09670 [Lysobacter fragariae]
MPPNAHAVVLPQASASIGANVTVSSHPNDPVATGWRPGFRALDTDQDGELSRAEANRNATLQQQFAVLDADHSGRLSRDETQSVVN